MKNCLCKSLSLFAALCRTFFIVCLLGIVNSKKFAIGGLFQKILGQKYQINEDFLFDLNLELHSGLEVGGFEIKSSKLKLLK